MSQCAHLDVCAFYNGRLEDIPNEGAFFKQLYCMNKSEKCARLKRSNVKDVGDVNNSTTPLGMDYSKVTAQ